MKPGDAIKALPSGRTSSVERIVTYDGDLDEGVAGQSLTITLKDGRSNTQACESHRGDFNQPFAESEIREKFHELAGTVLTAEGVAQVEAAVDRCEEWQSVRELVELMRRHGKA